MWPISKIVETLRQWLIAEKQAQHPAVERARRLTFKPSVYILGAGGRDPKAETPFTKKEGKLGSDCVGFTCWCLGHDRYQPSTFPLYDGWINTDSLMLDARGRRTWYTDVATPQPGDVVVFPSIHNNGKRIRMGHIGLVVEVPTGMPAGVWSRHDRREWLERVRVIDCAGASGRRLRGHAIAETSAAASWDKPDAIWARLVR